MPEPRIVLIAVGDGVLADSLRFSLELEGLAVNLCDETSLLAAVNAKDAPGCIVIDHDVFARILGRYDTSPFAGIGIPVLLMVGHETESLLDRVKTAGVTRLVEKPLLGGVLSEAIRDALDQTGCSGPTVRPS
jgi:FixJ family two-component response regulator